MKISRRNNVDENIYVDIDPKVLKKIVDGYGWILAEERWHWMSRRHLDDLYARASRGSSHAR